MRTTLELPDELLKRSKIEAVERGVSLKELVATALVKELGSAPAAPAARRVRFPLFSSKDPGTLDLSTADLARAEDEEDRRRDAVPG
jgi:hypothetical protein